MPSRSKQPTTEAEVIAAFCEHMRAHTMPLVRIVGGTPRSGGSGFLYQVGDRVFLLSVVHVFERDGWFIETDSTSNNETLLIDIPQLNWLVQGKVDAKGITIPADTDGLAWVELNLPTLRRKLESDERARGQNIALPMYSGPIDQNPDVDEVYGFAAAPPREFVFDTRRLVREAVCEIDMTYLDTDGRGFYRFKLPRQHRGYDYYGGSSGAPIASPEGIIVALVQGGCENDGVVYGIPISLYAGVITL